jgi:hypothetical protein
MTHQKTIRISPHAAFQSHPSTSQQETTAREGDEEESIAHTESGGRGHGDAEAAAEREQREQDEVPGVLLPVLEHGEHDCRNKPKQTNKQKTRRL